MAVRFVTGARMPNNQTDLDFLEPEKQSYLDRYLWLGFPAIFIFWFLYGLSQGNSQPDISFDRLNALFSGLAFWGVVWAILLQKKELELQRHELIRTREQIQGQKEQLESQALTLRQQRFENTFFSLLDFCGNTVNSFEVTINTYATPLTRKGRDCFFEYYSDFQHEFQHVKHKNNPLPPDKLCDTVYSEFLRHRKLDINHYFATLHKVIQFVCDGDTNPKDFYIDIVRAQLSAPQLALLFYSSLSTSGSTYFKPLIELTHFFRDFPHQILIDQSHTSLYDISAFNK
jgi:hypothetical protein